MTHTLTLSEDEALILFEFFERFDDVDEMYFVHPAEYVALGRLHAQICKMPADIFSPNYSDHLKAAWHRIVGDEFEGTVPCLRPFEENKTIDITRLDHLVLTVRDIASTVHFYERVLGMQKQVFGAGRVALLFGGQKINLHQVGQEFEPKAEKPTTGSADLCFITVTPLAEAMAHVQGCGVAIVEGPVWRMGARGKLYSFYFRDPDQNLLEVANEVDD